MGRRPLAVGSYGTISYRTLGPRRVRARTWVRDADGRRRDITREGSSKTSARENLLAAIVERAGFSGSTITSESTINDAAAAWLADVERLVADGQRAPNTARLYRIAFTRHVSPGVGALRLREATVPRLDAFLVGMREHHGAASTKTVRTVLNGIMAFAVRHGAVDRNPVRELSRITGAPTRVARAMTAAQRDDWLAKLEADEIAAARDLPDITRWMLATGCRIGEVIAVTFDEIDVHAKTVQINCTVVAVKGKGLQRMPTKTTAGERTLRLPGWAVDLVLRRGDRFGWTGPLFPVPGRRKGKPGATGGTWRDPSNTARDLREARERAGYGWVTSHVFRKTVATVMDEAGMTAREIADQLGHARPSLTQDVYMGRKAVGETAAVALEEMFSAGSAQLSPTQDDIAADLPAPAGGGVEDGAHHGRG